MAFFRSTSKTVRPAASRSHRWVVILFASLFLHLLIFNWANDHVGMPSWHDEPRKVITTSLLTPEAPPPPKPAVSKPKPKAKPRPRRPSAPPPPPPVAQNAVTGVGPTVDETKSVTSQTASEAPAETLAQAIADAGDGGIAAPSDAETTTPFKIDPPPSAVLNYDVFALRNEQKWYGSGAFRWESTGNRYSVTGEASISLIFNITVLNFKSEGMINEFGIAPVLYSEKPWHKSMTNTHFQHEARKISFSASEALYPYNGGEQDRASIIWQLAGIGRGDASQFQPGKEIDVVVAGTRDADTWRIQVIGEEEVETPYGKLATWHVVRTPRAGSHDQKIDIWLASQQEWYPVKVRYTYANGDYLDLALSTLTPLTE